jgi:methylenetetrahydrofolate dehydrogenase (NADP+) / methenyltetrahydrofolate cyclohydrolase
VAFSITKNTPKGVFSATFLGWVSQSRHRPVAVQNTGFYIFMIANSKSFVNSLKKAQILDGKKISEQILFEVKKQAAGRNLQLAVVQIGKNNVSEVYITEKQRIGKEIGMNVQMFWLPADIGQHALEQEIEHISANSNMHGVIVQLPLPHRIHREKALNCIFTEKDVDVLSEAALQRFARGTFPIVPPTVAAIQALFDAYSIEMRNKHVVLVGQGRLVGLPLGMWLKQKNVQFEIVTQETSNIASTVRQGDIVISGVGKANLITGDMVKNGAVVVDAGTSVEDGKTTGDVDFASVSKKTSYITPVPGGVGPLTVACLFRNLATLAESRV